MAGLPSCAASMNERFASMTIAEKAEPGELVMTRVAVAGAVKRYTMSAYPNKPPSGGEFG